MSARDNRHPIDPSEWLALWDCSDTRVISARTTEAVTPWFIGTTSPERVGYYDRMFTDGLWRQWWDGTFWRSDRTHAIHWRQVGDYPCWRGLLAPVADRDAAAFDDYCRTVNPTRDTRQNAFHAGIAYGRKNPQ